MERTHNTHAPYSLRARVLVGYGLVLALSAAPVAVAVVGLVRLGGAADAILSENYRSIEAAGAMADALERQDRGALLLVLRDLSGADLVADNAVAFEAALGRARANVTLPDEPALLRAVAATRDAFAGALGDLRPDAPGADARYRARVYPAFLDARAAVRALGAANERAMVAAGERSRSVARWSVAALAAGSVVALGLGLGLSLALSGRIARSEAALDRARRAFVATASHELKTPLTSLGLGLALLQERAAALSDRERALLDAAADDADRLRRLVADLLDLSRLEAGAAELHRAPVAPAARLDEAARSVRAAAEAGAVVVAVEAPGGLPDVDADAEAVVRVLVNLASNAVRHTPPGGRVALSAVRTDGGVRLAVTDAGDGVAPEVQARIFDPFVQADGAAGGSGLGLAISREIVRAHGGTLAVASAPGAGATFSFTLPLAPTGRPRV